jgi:tetratricopeptide (TPR) repeat protein
LARDQDNEILRNIDPQNLDAKYKIAGTYNIQGKHKKAYEILKSIIPLAPNNKKFLRETAFSLGNIGRLEEAAEMYNKIIALAPNDDGFFIN